MKVKNNLPVLMAKHGFRSLKKLSIVTDITYFRLRQFANQENKTLDYEIVEKLCQVFGCNIGDLLYLDKHQAS